MDDSLLNLAGLLLGLLLTLAGLALGALMVAGTWKMFVKGGQPGWGIFVPIYNCLLMVRIVGMPDWTLLLFLVPVISLAFHIIVSLELAKRFHQTTAFTVGLILLPTIFWAVLGFGKAEYSPLTTAAAGNTGGRASEFQGSQHE